MGKRDPVPMQQQPAPSMSDILTAVAALRPAPVEEKGIGKYAPTIIVAIILALCLWVGATLVSVGQTLSTMLANVNSIQKSVDEIKVNQNATGDKVADLQSRVAQHDLRLNNIDALNSRLAERLRIVEGQKPLSDGKMQ